MSNRERQPLREKKDIRKRKLPFWVKGGLLVAGLGLAGEAYKERHAIEEKMGLGAEKELAIPELAREHLIGIPELEDDTKKAQPFADWEMDMEGVYSKGEKCFLALPDGSFLHIPADDKNKAYNLPYGAKDYKEITSLRYPVKAIKKMGLELGADGFRHAETGETYAVLEAGHLLKLATKEEKETFLPFGEQEWQPLSKLEERYDPPYDLSQISTEVPHNYVDVNKQPELQDIKCELGLDTYNNSFGVQLYPEGYPTMVLKKMVRDLALVAKELATNPNHYRLGIGDAKRPIEAQRYLFENYKGYASDPDKKPPHVLGKAIDVVLLDENYMEVFPKGFEEPSEDVQAKRSVHPPKNWEEAEAQGWPKDYFDAWWLMASILRKHHFEPKGERWHFEYQK